MTFLCPRQNTVNHQDITEAGKAVIMREVLEDHISPNELSRKYSIPAYAIRDWVKKAGHRLPKSYKRFAPSRSDRTVVSHLGLISHLLIYFPLLTLTPRFK